MMTLTKLQELVYADPDTCGEASRLEVEAIVKKTIETLGFNVGTDDVIVDPRPQPVNIYPTAPRQQNAHWRGGRSRRSYKR